MKKKKRSCPKCGQSRHNQRQWSAMKPTPEYETQSGKVIQQSPISSNSWLGLFCLYLWKCSFGVDGLYSLYKQENSWFLLFSAKLLNTFWLYKTSHRSLRSQICWLCFDDHIKSPINAGLCSVARILNFSTHGSHQTCCEFFCRLDSQMHCIIPHTV